MPSLIIQPWLTFFLLGSTPKLFQKSLVWTKFECWRRHRWLYTTVWPHIVAWKDLLPIHSEELLEIFIWEEDDARSVHFYPEFLKRTRAEVGESFWGITAVGMGYNVACAILTRKRNSSGYGSFFESDETCEKSYGAKDRQLWRYHTAWEVLKKVRMGFVNLLDGVGCEKSRCFLVCLFIVYYCPHVHMQPHT